MNYKDLEIWQMARNNVIEILGKKMNRFLDSLERGHNEFKD